jgi:hypothetical protein
MKKSSKNSNIINLEVKFDGGLNYSSSPTNLAENEMKRTTNWIYDVSTDILMTRPGTTCITGAVAHKLANPIRKLYYYEKTSSVSYLVCASGSKLYYLSTDEWIEIGSLSDATTIPSFLTFNNKLLIADGNADIRTWDGTTFGTLAGSPQANCLIEIKGRVACNATDEPDSVYLSAAKDETKWNTSTEGAIGIKAGYGDMLEVNGLSVYGDDLIISKKSNTGKVKRFYRLNTADVTSSNWVCSLLSNNNGSQGTNTIESAFNNIFFCDDNGFKSLKGVQEYGDMQVDSTGEKVNSLFATNTCDEVKFIPLYSSIFFSIGDRIFVYSEKGGKGRFTDLLLAQGRIRSFCQAGSVVYLGGNNGYLYKLDSSVATDETVPGTRVNFINYARTRTFTFFNDIILRKAQIFLTPKLAGTGKIYTIDYAGTATLISTFTTTAEEYLYDATGDLNDATSYLSDSGSQPWVETTRNRVRGTDIAFEFVMESGAVGKNTSRNSCIRGW